MKKIDSNLRAYNFFIKPPSGSILIWTVLFGFVLTSVFFFYIMRQRATITAQRDTAQTLNAKMYLESYADYVEKLDATSLNALKTSGVDFDGIKGSVTDEPSEITGVADAGATVTYGFNGEIFIAWNKCPNSMKGDLLVNDILYPHDIVTECPAGQEYDDVIGPIAVTNPFTIKTLNAPFYYSITPKDSSTRLADNKWYMSLKIDMDYGKKVTIERTF
jgi:hypothetical protein